MALSVCVMCVRVGICGLPHVDTIWSSLLPSRSKSPLLVRALAYTTNAARDNRHNSRARRYNQGSINAWARCSWDEEKSAPQRAEGDDRKSGAWYHGRRRKKDERRHPSSAARTHGPTILLFQSGARERQTQSAALRVAISSQESRLIANRLQIG